ncbi:MAG: xanthine dehydrogenase family protein subunit M [Negativicutes bacterium]|nr:xanthine dehydrogenase family protein subunit M [Negativicutes bacterium]
MPFVYHAPRTLENLFATLDSLEQYSLLAGGTDLIVKWKEKLIDPKAVVDINGIAAMKGIEECPHCFSIGALVTHYEITASARLRAAATALYEAAGEVGSPQIRHIATIGGNIVNASPAADTAPALLALNAEAEIQSRTGISAILVADLFTGTGRTCLKPGQIISRIKVPASGQNQGSAFVKFGKRKALAIAVVNGAAWITIDGDKIKDVRLAMGAVAPTPIRLLAIEDWLRGQTLAASTFKTAGTMAEKLVRPISDIRSSAEYRGDLARQVVIRALETAARRAKGGCACG